MRTLRIVLLVVSPALTGGASLAAAQSVERTDVPARGILRVTFDPRIMTWNDEFTDAGRRRLGFGLTGDTVGSRYIPALAALEQNVRTVTGDLVPVIRPQVMGPGDVQPLLPRFVASLGAGLLSVRQERRTYPITAELGVTNRLSVSLTVPIVRVATRSSLNLSTTRANLGLNPRLTVTSADAAYLVFFTQFDTTLARFDTTFLLTTDTLTGALVQAAIVDPATGFGSNRIPFRTAFRYGLVDVEV